MRVNRRKKKKYQGPFFDLIFLQKIIIRLLYSFFALYQFVFGSYFRAMHLHVDIYFKRIFNN